jgi:hypothetical protein
MSEVPLYTRCSKTARDVKSGKRAKAHRRPHSAQIPTRPRLPMLP